MARRRHLALLTAVAVAVAGYGTAHSAGQAGPRAPSASRAPSAPDAPSAPGSAATPGLPRAVRDAACPTPAHHQASVPLPAGFAPVAAIRCTNSIRRRAGRGQWEVQVRQVASHGFGRLLAALRRPDARQPADVLCATVAVPPPLFVLADRDGQVILPRVPTDECRQPQQQTFAALRGLPWVTVSRRPEQQLETQAEVVSGCSPAWKDMISVLGGQDALHPTAGGPLLRSRPSSVQVCVYRVGASPFQTRFVRGGHVSGAAEATLLRGTMAGRAIAGCPRPHRQFAVLQARAYVEIGGCHRVLRPGNGIGQASPAALAIINQVGRG